MAEAESANKPLDGYARFVIEMACLLSKGGERLLAGRFVRPNWPTYAWNKTSTPTQDASTDAEKADRVQHQREGTQGHQSSFHNMCQNQMPFCGHAKQT